MQYPTFTEPSGVGISSAMISMQLFVPVFQATTTYPDGTPIPNLKLNAAITVKLIDQTENTFNAEATGSKEGDIHFPFEVPNQATTINIEVTIQRRRITVTVTDLHLHTI